MGDLTFTAKYSRKVQPWNYENIVVGLEMQFPIVVSDFQIKELQESIIKNAFKVVVDAVESEIDRRLQAIHAKERERR